MSTKRNSPPVVEKPSKKRKQESEEEYEEDDFTLEVRDTVLKVPCEFCDEIAAVPIVYGAPTKEARDDFKEGLVWLKNPELETVNSISYKNNDEDEDEDDAKSDDDEDEIDLDELEEEDERPMFHCNKCSKEF